MPRLISLSFLVISLLITISCTAGDSDYNQTFLAGSVSGFYEGTLQSREYGEVSISLNLRNKRDTLTGMLITSLGDFPLKQQILSENKLKLQFFVGEEDTGTIAGRWTNGTIQGQWELGADGGPISLQYNGTAKPPLQPEHAPTLDLTTSEWRKDLQFLASELPRFHGNAFHTVSRKVFEDSIQALDARLPSLEDHEVFAALGRIVAMISDGHTYLQLPETFHRYPIQLRAFGDTLRITHTTNGFEHLLGGRILKIRNTNIQKAKQLVSRQIARENEQYVRKELPWFMIHAEILHANGIISEPEKAPWLVETLSGERLTVQLVPTPVEENLQWISAAQEKPLYLQRSEEDLWRTFLPNSGTLYIGFRGYPARPAFRNFFEEVFQFVEKNPVKKMLIDLRQNSGGDFTKTRDLLLPKLKNHPLNKKDRLFVAIGRHTFSAAMTNAADFLKGTNASLVGEPTGARPNGWQEKGQFALPNSRLTVAYSKRYYRFLDEDVPAVMPHKHIPLKWEDFRKGRDPILQWVTSQP